MKILPKEVFTAAIKFSFWQGLGHTGIHVFGSQLHTHLTGRKVFTKHVRHGVELPELNRDNHYSPHFQEIRRLPVPVEVLPVRWCMICSLQYFVIYGDIRISHFDNI